MGVDAGHRRLRLCHVFWSRDTVKCSDGDFRKSGNLIERAPNRWFRRGKGLTHDFLKGGWDTPTDGMSSLAAAATLEVYSVAAYNFANLQNCKFVRC